MPYISKEDREHIDCKLQLFQHRFLSLKAQLDISDVVRILRDVPSGKTKGALNYFVSRVAVGVCCNKGLSYSTVSDAISALRDAADEIQRRLLGPYEDKAIEKNGDLQEFKDE